MLGLTGLAASVALAGPRWGRTEIRTESRALSLVFAMDISRSMLAEDASPNRLQRSVREARRLIQDLEGDRLGLIAFAGRSYILAPLTVDGSAIRLYLDALDPDLASEGGTDLSSVLAQGGQLLGATTDAADRVLVVFTDGEAHDTLTDVVRQAEALKEAGVHLIMVAEGRPAPSRIPIRDSTGTLLEYKRDEDGTVIQTQRRDDILRAVVDAAEGTLVPSEAPDQGGAVRDLVSAMKRSPTSATRTADLVPRAWIPGLVAALLLLAYTIARPGPALIGTRRPAPARPARAAAQRPTAGGRALAAGDPTRAAAEFLKEAGAGRAKDTAFYNAGTAALEAGRLEVARGALVEAAKSLDPGLRYRALYNLGPGGPARRPRRYVAAGGAARRRHRPAAPGAAAGALVGPRQMEPGARRAPPSPATAAERRRRRAAAAERRTQGAGAAAASAGAQGPARRVRPSRSSTRWSGGSG